MDTIDFNGQMLTLLPETNWHLAHPDYSALFNNVYLSKGTLLTISAVRQKQGMENAVNPQITKAMNDPKEQLWEQVRKEVDPNLPSRIGAFFVVKDKQAATTIDDRWFKGENRHLLLTRPVKGSVIFDTDASWLDASQSAWEDSAKQYWKGSISKSPMPERLVHGAVYFPDWEKAPFGVMV
jgi:hypothetical protein